MSVYDKPNSIVESGDKEADRRLPTEMGVALVRVMLNEFGVRMGSRADVYTLTEEQSIFSRGFQVGYTAAMEGKG